MSPVRPVGEQAGIPVCSPYSQERGGGYGLHGPVRWTYCLAVQLVHRQSLKSTLLNLLRSGHKQFDELALL